MPKTKPFRTLRDRVRSDPARAARAAAYKRAMDAVLALAEMRERRGVTQATLADALGVTQQRLSQMERQEDLFLSTLASYVAALGGKLEVVAVFPDERVDLEVPVEGATEAALAESE